MDIVLPGPPQRTHREGPHSAPAQRPATLAQLQTKARIGNEQLSRRNRQRGATVMQRNCMIPLPSAVLTVFYFYSPSFLRKPLDPFYYRSFFLQEPSAMFS